MNTEEEIRQRLKEVNAVIEDVTTQIIGAIERGKDVSLERDIKKAYCSEYDRLGVLLTPFISIINQ